MLSEFLQMEAGQERHPGVYVRGSVHCPICGERNSGRCAEVKSLSKMFLSDLLCCTREDNIGTSVQQDANGCVVSWQ